MMDKQELRQYIDKYRKCLLESVEWWQKFSPDAKHGGFYNYLGRDGKVLFTDKNVRQQGRDVLLFERAYNEIEPRTEWLDLALRAEYRFDAASVAKWQAEKRFRSVGALRFGELGGVPYVEAGARRDDRFAFLFDVDPAVKLYCLEFDYPDDAKRTCDLIVQFREPHSDDYALQVGYFTGD